ncbi:MAG: DNA-binding protein [Nitriliruptor sp.]|nr:MAG: DNA-binding protein [Nitriliruptor sp.]
MATKLLYRINEASEVSSISRSRLYELMASGELESVKLGSTRLIPHAALEAFVARLRSGAGAGEAA